MGAGKLDRRVSFYAEQTTRSDSGALVTAWVMQFARWAEVMPQSGGESFAASDQVTAKQTTVFRIRYVAGITPKMRIRYEGAEYDIEDVKSLDRRKFLHITAHAREVSPGGT